MAVSLFTSRGPLNTIENDAWYVQGSVMVHGQLGRKVRSTCIDERVCINLWEELCLEESTTCV